MASPSTQTYTITSLFDWTGGLRNRRVNPLFFPESSIINGENIDLRDGSLRIRSGWGVLAQPVEPGADGGETPGLGHVRMLRQVHFAAAGRSYILAQIGGPSGLDTLYACPATLDSLGNPASWNRIYELPPGAGPVEIGVLRDRAVITEGLADPPVVFAGCLADDGSDWAVPRAVLMTRNAGADWHDVTGPLCDPDPDTGVELAGLQPGQGILAVCVDICAVRAFFLWVAGGSSPAQGMVVEGHAGQWTSGAGWVDGTGGLTGDGSVSYSGDAFAADYHIENDMPGHWFRFRWTSVTPPNLVLQSIRFKGPCRALSVLGPAGPAAVASFIYWDDSDKSAKDFTAEVSDSSMATYARLNDGAEPPVGMNSSDAIYVRCSRPFYAVDVTPHNDFNNRYAGAVSAAYWNGSQWTAVFGLSDKTQEPAGKSFAKKGRISWTLPGDWRENSPMSPQYPRGYWIRLKVSSNLSPRTYLSHVGVWPQPEPPRKYRFALTLRDRLVLAGRSDAPDAVDISRPLDVNGFTGSDALSVGLGGSGRILAAVEAFNQAYIGQRDNWVILNYSGNGVSMERAETAGQVPVNNRVVVRAPHTEADYTNLMGLYYLNHNGAWYFSGSRLYGINHDVSWWDPASDVPRLDLGNLGAACGAYWPQQNRIVWAVPMLTGDEADGRNNRLIVYDLRRKRWLPPFTVSAASLALVNMARDSASPDCGEAMLCGGDYQGRILHLFGPGSAAEGEDPVTAWLETGWLHLGTPHCTKIIRHIGIFGKCDGSALTLTVRVDGAPDPAAVLAFDPVPPEDDCFFGTSHSPTNVSGQFFKFRLDFEGPGEVYGIQVASTVVRDRPAM